MGKETRPFSGHFHQDDPRWALTGAAGCTWPTIPAQRYLLVSGNATGIWATVMMDGFKFGRNSPNYQHDPTIWVTFQNPIGYGKGQLTKTYNRDTRKVTWRLQLDSIYCYFGIDESWEKEESKCNGIITLGEATCTPDTGNLGSDCKLLPCQYDTWIPEEPWPPT